VGGYDRGEALPRQSPHELQDLVLVFGIQVGIRLVQEEEPRPLSEPPGDEDKPHLAPGELGIGTPGKPRKPHRFQGLQSHLKVRLLRGGEEPKVRRPSHEDHLDHPEAEDRPVDLRDVTDVLCPLPCGKPVEVLPAE